MQHIILQQHYIVGVTGQIGGSLFIHAKPLLIFEAATINFHAINLSWSLNETTDRAIVIRNESGYAGYPVDKTNGTLIYNNTGEYYNDTGLNESTAYYYTVWGWNNTESEFSVINQTATNTTQALNPPSLFSASTFNETQINLTWTKGIQADNTTILRNAYGIS